MSIKPVWRKRPEPGRYWVYDIYVGGRRVHTPRGEGFPTKAECQDAVAAIRSDYRRDRYLFPADRSSVRISELREAWLAKLAERGRSHAHMDRVDRSLRLFERVVPGLVVADIATEHIEKHYTARLRKGVRPQTAATDIITIVGALNEAPALFRSLADWRPPRKPKGIVSWSEGRQRVITHDEEALIIEALINDGDPLREQDARIFWFAVRTGMREGEILGLLKTSVCFDRAIKMEHGWIEVRRSHGSERTKTGRKRMIPMSGSVARMLKPQIADVGASVYLFPGRLGQRRAVTTFVQSIEAACKSAGVIYGRNKPGGMVFHDTRHTAATRMLHAGIDVKTVGSILGHSDEYMTMRYAHATASSRQAAVGSLEDGEFQVRYRFDSTAQTDEAPRATPRPKLVSA